MEAGGGGGGALGAMYESLSFCCGGGGLVRERLGGTSSSLISDCSNGPEMVLPLIVGVTPGVSDEDADEEEESALEDELREVLTMPVGISFLAIVRESALGGSWEGEFDSVDGLES